MSATIRQIHIEQLPDDHPDVSWLDATDPQDAARLITYADGRWSLIGIRAVAELQVPYGAGRAGWISQTIYSGGLWNIESDSDLAYLDQVANEQIDELVAILRELGVPNSEIVRAAEETDYRDPAELSS